MLKCPHCHEETISGFKVHFSNPGTELICPKCKKTSIVPTWPKLLAFVIIGLYFLSKLFISDEAAIILLIGAAVIYLPFTYFTAEPLLPQNEEV